MTTSCVPPPTASSRACRTPKCVRWPPGATAFANRGEYFNVAFMMKWKNPKNDAKVRELKQKPAALIRSRGF